MNSKKILSLLLHLFMIINSVSPSNSRVVLSNPQNVKVSLELYYETLCPHCSNFIVNCLNKLFQNGFISVVDLKLIPYGNARIGPNSSITCQNEHFQFIYCVETLVFEHKYPEWETCFEKLGLDPKAISDCYTSGKGTELELQHAAKTNSPEPPHQYVPWRVVDGQPLHEDYENFISYICNAYNGTSHPEACSNIKPNYYPQDEGRAPVKSTKKICNLLELCLFYIFETMDACMVFSSIFHTFCEMSLVQ